MAINAKNVAHGMVGATPILVNMARIESSAPVKVVLSAAYARATSAGTPSPPSMTGCASAGLDYPRTVNSGVTLSLLKHEADALVAAGAASYA